MARPHRGGRASGGSLPDHISRERVAIESLQSQWTIWRHVAWQRHRSRADETGRINAAQRHTPSSRIEKGCATSAASGPAQGRSDTRGGHMGRGCGAGGGVCFDSGGLGRRLILQLGLLRQSSHPLPNRSACWRGGALPALRTNGGGDEGTVAHPAGSTRRQTLLVTPHPPLPTGQKARLVWGVAAATGARWA